MAVISNSHTLLRGLNGDVPMGQMFVSGLEYSGDVITGYSGSAIGASSQDYSAGDNIDITNHVISVTGVPPIDVEAPLYIVSDTPTGKIIGFSGELSPNIDVINSTPNFVSGHYESGELTISAKDWENDIMGATANAAYVGSGLAVEWVTAQGYLTSHQDLSYISGKIDQNSADIYELSGKIKDYDVVGGNNATVQTATAYGSTTFTVSTPDWSTAITAASANAADVASSVTTAWVTAQGYITSAPTATGTLSAVNNITPSYVSGGYADGTLSLSGRDWTTMITAASANATATTTAWVNTQGYITAQKEYTGISPVTVNNTANTISVSAYEVSGVNIDVIKDDANGLVIFSGNSAGRDWTPEITAASANATAVTTAWVTAQGYSTAGRYVGITPIVVDNTANEISADTAVLTAESPIYIETTTSNGVEINTIKFSGNTGGNSFNASVAGDTINYSGASSMRANFYNYEGRTAANDWVYFNSITLYPEGGSTSYGNTTFTLPVEYGYEGLIYRNGNQYKYLPVPFWSSYTSGTSGLSFYGDSAWDARYIYFYSLDQDYKKFSLTVPKHSRIEISYNAGASTRGYGYSTPANLFLTNTTSTADGTAYNLDMSPLVWPTADDQFNFHADFSWHNTGNYDTDVYIRMDTRAMGNAWNPTGYYYIGGPNNEKLTYRIYPDLV